MIALAEKRTGRSRRTWSGARTRGGADIKPAHNAVFAILGAEGARAADIAARAGITRQSMGEVIRDMVGLGILEMAPDPDDGRAKIVRYTDYGMEVAQQGYGHIMDVERVLRDALGDADVDATRRVLAGMIEMLGEDSPQPVTHE